MIKISKELLEELEDNTVEVLNARMITQQLIPMRDTKIDEYRRQLDEITEIRMKEVEAEEKTCENCHWRGEWEKLSDTYNYAECNYKVKLLPACHKTGRYRVYIPRNGCKKGSYTQPYKDCPAWKKREE